MGESGREAAVSISRCSSKSPSVEANHPFLRQVALCPERLGRGVDREGMGRERESAGEGEN